MNGVPCAWFRWATFLLMMYSSIRIGYVIISILVVGIMLIYDILVYDLFLGMAICFNPLLSYFFLNDCIFL